MTMLLKVSGGGVPAGAYTAKFLGLEEVPADPTRGYGAEALTPEPAQPEPQPPTPKRSLVVVDELPTPPDGALVALSLSDLFSAVREAGAKLAWQDGEVAVVPSELATPAVAFAVAEHQADLRPLVPAEPQVCL